MALHHHPPSGRFFLPAAATHNYNHYHLLQGDPAETLPAFVRSSGASLLVTDDSPLRLGRAGRAAVAAALPPGVPLHEVDAHNVVPAWAASDKREYALSIL